jgi:hypothetical protein
MEEILQLAVRPRVPALPSSSSGPVETVETDIYLSEKECMGSLLTEPDSRTPLLQLSSTNISRGIVSTYLLRLPPSKKIWLPCHGCTIRHYTPSISPRLHQRAQLPTSAGFLRNRRPAWSSHSGPSQHPFPARTTSRNYLSPSVYS